MENEGYEHIEVTGDVKDNAEYMKRAEDKLGMKDFHLVIHLKDGEEVIIRNFILMAVRDGKPIFSCRVDADTEAFLALAEANIESTRALIEKIRQAMAQSEMQRVGRLEDEITKLSKEGRIGQG